MTTERKTKLWLQPRMLTPMAFEDNPPTTVADPTTQNFQWGTPTQSAQPGSISSPDTPKMTSKAEVGETLPLDLRPKATKAQDPKPTNPADDGSSDSGGDSKDALGVSNGDPQAPQQDTEGESTPEQASPHDPQQNGHPPDPVSNGPAGESPAGVPSAGDPAVEDPTGKDPAGVPSGGDPAGNLAGGDQPGGDSAGNPAGGDLANNNPASDGPLGEQIPPAAASGAEGGAALLDSNEDSQSPKEGSQDAPVTPPVSPQDPKEDDSAQDAGQPQSGSEPGPESPLPEFNVNTNQVYNVDNHELVPGGPAITIDNIPYSLDPSASVLMSGTKTIDLPRPTPMMPAFEVGSHTYTANEASQYVVGDETLIPGEAPIVVDQITYSIAPSATALISNGQTLTPASPPENPPAITIAGKEIKADTRPRITISGQGLVAGGPTITINSVPFALAPSASALIAGSSSFSIQAQEIVKNDDPMAPNPQGDRSHPVVDLGSIINGAFTKADPAVSPDKHLALTINSVTYTADSSSQLIIGTQTLLPGGPAITISSQTISLPASTSSPTPSTPTGPYAVVTLASQQYTCYKSSSCTIESQTLTPNGNITLSGGDEIRYGSTGIDVVEAPETRTQTQSPVVGEVITSHIEGLTPVTAGVPAGPTSETSGSGEVGVTRWGVGVGVGVVVVVLVGWR